MSLPLYDGGAWAALFLGVFFGLALEGAGFGSPRKLTAQFTLRDFAVFKVMFTAVLVCAAGLWLAETTGLIGPRSVYVPTLYFWSFALGGGLIGTGFAIGGYCPGTSVVGLASGRWDALVFMLGMVVGIGAFAAGFEPMRPFYFAAKGADGQTLDVLLGLPQWLVLVVLALAAVAGFRLGTRLERRFGGPFKAEAVAGSSQPVANSTAKAPT